MSRRRGGEREVGQWWVFTRTDVPVGQRTGEDAGRMSRGQVAKQLLHARRSGEPVVRRGPGRGYRVGALVLRPANGPEGRGEAA